MQNALLMGEHIAYGTTMQVAYAPKVPKKKYDGPRLARRQHWLSALVSAQGGPARVGLDLDTPASHISAMTSGKRGVGDEMADRIESVFNKPNGWLDRPTDSESDQRVAPTATLDQAIELLGRAIESAPDKDAKASACEMLALFIKDPAANSDMVPLIVKRLLGEPGEEQNQGNRKAA